MKPKFNTARFRNRTAGDTLVTAIVVCFGTVTSHAADNLWTGTTSTEWNEASNWTEERIPEKAGFGDNAIINTNTGNIATIGSANLLKTPQDIKVGFGGGTNGRLDHVASDASTGGGNWMTVGESEGTGVYNLVDTAVPSGGITGFSQGAGNMFVQGDFINGTGSGSTGTTNINTMGTLTCGGNLFVGYNGGTGTVNIESGTLRGNNQFIIGENSTGTINMDGGVISIGNEFWIGQGGSGVGEFTLNGGAINATNWTVVGRGGSDGLLTMNGGTLTKSGGGATIIGDGGGSVGDVFQHAGDVMLNGEFWVGQGGGTGSYTMNAGTFTVNNWVAFGRDGGTGTFNMVGGELTKTDGGNFIVGASGPGTLNHSGGKVDVQGGITWIGENGNGSYTLSGTGAFITSEMIVAVGGSSTSSVSLDGGYLDVGRLVGGAGASSVDFNGTQILATGENTEFLSGFGTATIEAGGLLIDSNGFNLGAPQMLTGTGGIVKTGEGNLRLSAANSYTGATMVDGGGISITTDSTATGAITLADETVLGLTQVIDGEIFAGTDMTFGSSGDTTLNIDLGDFDGNPLDALLDIAGTTTVNGIVSVNIADTWPFVGSIPLVSYASPKSGTGSFALGTLPNGVQGILIDDGVGLVSLNVTRVNQAYWTGAVDDVWETTEGNWIDDYQKVESTYADGDPVLFDDRVEGLTANNVILNTTVAPGGTGVTFAGDFVDYTLSGTGKITGTANFQKENPGALDISTINDYTGITTLSGGITTVATLSNGLVASSLGAATADAGNLVFNGGTLDYTGAATSIDRGFTINGFGGGITTANDLAISGPVVSTGGNFSKSGAGNLTFTNTGSIGFGTQNPGINLLGGTLTFDGSGTQVVNVSEELMIGMEPDVSANLVLKQTTLNVGTWIGLGRGNGSTGSVCSLTATDSTINTANFGSGYDAGVGAYNAIQLAVMNDSTWNCGNQTVIGESNGSDTTMTLNGSSSFTSGGTVHVGRNDTSSGTLNINGDSTFNAMGWFTLGRYANSTGTANVSGGSLNQMGIDTLLFVAEDGTGTLNVSGTGLVTVVGAALTIAPNTGSNGTVNLDGGTISVRAVGTGNGMGSSTFNFNGGLLQAATGANVEFMTNIDSVKVLANGANIDSNGQTIAINLPLLDGSGGGGLSKSGDGFLQLNDTNSYTGTTTVSAGSLGGTGLVAGPLVVNASGTIAPGTSVGTFAAGATTIAGTYSCEIDGATSDLLDVTGSLNLTGATLTVIASEPTGLEWTIATYSGALTGTFASVPAGYMVDTATTGVVKLISDGSGSHYDAWAATKGLDGSNNGSTQDPEFDGIANSLEFVLSGDPLASDTDILPTLDASGSSFVFSFTRADESETEISLLFQHGTDLATWTDVVIGANNAGSGPEVDIVENGAAPDSITVTIPKGASTELFGRLKAAK